MRNRIPGIKKISAFVLAIGLPGVLASANAASDLSKCTDNSRECLIASAMSYINGLMLMDPAKPRFAPNVRRTLEGARFAGGYLETSGEANLRSGMGPPDPSNPELLEFLAREKLTFQQWMDRQNSSKIIIQTIVVDERAGEVVFVWGGIDPQQNLSKSMERFKIVKGLVTEIESADIDRKALDDTLGWPAAQPCLKRGDGKLVPCDK